MGDTILFCRRLRFTWSLAQQRERAPLEQVGLAGPQPGQLLAVGERGVQQHLPRFAAGHMRQHKRNIVGIGVQQQQQNVIVDMVAALIPLVIVFLASLRLYKKDYNAGRCFVCWISETGRMTAAAVIGWLVLLRPRDRDAATYAYNAQAMSPKPHQSFRGISG